MRELRTFVYVLCVSVLFSFRSGFAESTEVSEMPSKILESELHSLDQILKSNELLRKTALGEWPSSLKRFELSNDSASDDEKGRSVLQGQVKTAVTTGLGTELVLKSAPFDKLKNSNISIMGYDFEESELNAVTKRGPLTIRIWICPNFESARRLFFIRRGGDIGQLRNGKVEFSPKCAILDKDRSIGEASYRKYSQMDYSSPLEEGHPGTCKDIIGFLRNNVVIECQTGSFGKDLAGKWISTGISRQDFSSCIKILKCLDELIENSSR